MKVLYFSTSFFMDMDLELIKRLSDIKEVYYLCDLHKSNNNSTVLKLKSENLREGIVSFNEVKHELPPFFANYINYNNSFFIHHRKGGLLNKLRNVLQLYRFIKKVNPDIIHFCFTLPPPFIFILYLRFPKIFTIHDPFPHSGEYKLRKELIKKISIKKSNKIVLLNKQDKDRFSSYYKVPQKRIIQSSIGVYSVYQNFHEKDVTAIPYSVLFYGRISPYKGIEYLCKAAVELKKNIPDLSVFILGKGDFWFDIKPYEEGGVKFIHRFIEIDELVEYLKASQVVVCPYTDATQSGVIMTALAFKKPIIATNVGGIPEVIEHNKTGLLIEPKNHNTLREALNLILSSQALQDRIREEIENEYLTGHKSWENIAYNLCKEYDSLLKN